MKTKLLVALLWCSIFAKAQAFDPNFYIFLGIGQSNMQGKGSIEYEDKSKGKKFSAEDWARYRKMAVVDFSGAKAGTWTTAYPPLVRPDTGLGVTDYFGRYLVKGLDSIYSIGVVVVAVDGCATDAFSKDSTTVAKYLADSGTGSWVKEAAAAYGNYPYGRLVEMARKAQESGVIKGIIYHQGETDANGTSWLDNVYQLYRNLLADLNLNIDSVPFIAGEPVQKDMGGACYGSIPWVDKIPSHFKSKSGKDCAYVVSSAYCSGSSDTFHFSSAGYRKIGQRYGEVMLPLLIGQGAIPMGVQSVSSNWDSPIFNVRGEQLDSFQPGLNISNGKKYLILNP